MLLCLLLSTGCGAEQSANASGNYYEASEADEGELAEGYNDNINRIYDNAMDRILDDSDTEEMEGTDIFDKLLRKFLGVYHRTYRVFRTISPIILIGSEVVGLLMYFLARENNKIKHTGKYIFCIGIPVVVIVIVFGVGIANEVLLY